ncbi:hypothetical protein U1Q18_016963, partial [Sarracenia purpurea var. burkii]
MNSTKHDNKFFRVWCVEAAPAPIALLMTVNTAGFALKVLHFSNFSSLGNNFFKYRGVDLRIVVLFSDESFDQGFY